MHTAVVDCPVGVAQREARAAPESRSLGLAAPGAVIMDWWNELHGT